MGALIGRTAIVTERINGSAVQGRVKLDGDNWQAVCLDTVAAEPGDEVEIVGYNSIILHVKLLKIPTC